jgi:carboxylesterase
MLIVHGKIHYAKQNSVTLSPKAFLSTLGGMKKAFCGIAVILSIVLFLWWGNDLPFYHEETQTNLPAPDETACFSPKCRSIIKKNGNDRAILMIHGFPGTPQIWSYFAEYFSSKGYDVYCPLLPGFGTDPKDLEKTNFSGWYDYAKRYYEKLRAEYRHVSIIGHSMGGSIALKIAEEADVKPDAIVTIAAPVAYNSIKEGIITTPFFSIARPLSWFQDAYGEKTTDGKDRSADGHEDWTGYDGLFVKAGLSITFNLTPIRENLGSITCPLFAIQDRRDRTVPAQNLRLIAEALPEAKILKTHLKPGWLHTYHCLPMYHSIQGELAQEILEFLKTKESLRTE